MPRKRVNLALIENISARKATLNRRRPGLLKRIDEVTTQCDIPGCVILFNPLAEEPFVWPSKEIATELLMKYESLPKKDREKKKVCHTKFMEDRVNRLQEHVKRWEQKNKEAWGSIIIHQINMGIRKIEDLNIVEAEILLWYTEMKHNQIQREGKLFPPPPVREPPQVIKNLPLQDLDPTKTHLPFDQPPQSDVKEGNFSAKGEMNDVDADSFLVGFESTACVFDENWMWPMHNNEQNNLDFLNGYEPTSSLL